MFAIQPEHAKQWLQQRTTDLFQGQLDPLLTDLHLAGHPELTHFFTSHQARLPYVQFQEAGYPIGSRSVDSEVTQFKTRLTGPGMRWSRAGAQRMLTLRAAVLVGSFDVPWSQAA